VVVGAVALFAALFPTACSSDLDDFCHQLKSTYDLTDLRAALDRDDNAAIEQALGQLQRLDDLAPTQIRSDVDAVVSAVVGAVRAVVPVTGPNGEHMPVDLTQLNAALDSVSASSVRVVAYGQKYCQLSASDS
jgi:hypothetical protein